MHERIKDFIKQATLIMEVKHEGYRGNSYTEQVKVLDKEKFAELIVRECDRYVAEQYDESEPWMQPGDLLKHFGVKQ